MRLSVSHAVYFTPEPKAVAAFYSELFQRRFERRGSVLVRDFWYVSEPVFGNEPTGWNVYFATSDFDAFLTRAGDCRVVEVEGTRFAFVEEPSLGRFVVQEDGGGDSHAHFLCEEPERSLRRAEDVLGIYAEPGSESFATVAAAYSAATTTRWVPVWLSNQLDPLARRATDAGARITDVRATWLATLDLLDPWENACAISDPHAFDPDELPDLVSVADAERELAAGQEPEPRFEARLKRLRAKWLSV